MTTTGRCFGGGLMFAGLIVMLIGLAVGRAIRPRDESPPRERRETDRA